MICTGDVSLSLSANNYDDTTEKMGDGSRARNSYRRTKLQTTAYAAELEAWRAR